MLDWLLARATRLLSRRCGLHLLRVASRPVRAFAPSPVAGIRCGLVGRPELRRWCRDPEMELSARQVRAALGRGDVCIGAWAGSVPVGYQWLAFSAVPHVAGIWVQFGERDCYVYKKLVLPAFRGRRIAELLSAKADEIVEARGRARIVSLIAVDNTPSWKAAQRTGNRCVGYVGFLRCFGVNFPFHTAGARQEGLGLSLPAGAQPGVAEGGLTRA